VLLLIIEQLVCFYIVLLRISKHQFLDLAPLL
jgi:hypothetical protein